MTTPHPEGLLIGTAKGPGEHAHEYTFITPDWEDQIKAGEFVYYCARADGAAREIVGRVMERRPVRLLPDPFLANPAVPPAHLAAMLGYPAGVDATNSGDENQGRHELFEVTARTLGYFDEGLGDFINPRIPPRAGRPVYLCDDATLAGILSTKAVGQVGGAHIGSLLSREAEAVPIVIDASAITSTHLAIIAGTGAGKSYLAGVLVEELMKPHNRGCALIIDPHGEYGTLEELANLPQFSDAKAGYRARVRVLKPEKVKVRINSLNIGDFRTLLYSLTERQEYVLQRALRELNIGPERRSWGFDRLMFAVRQVGEADDDGSQEMDGVGRTDSSRKGVPRYQESIEGVLWRLDSTFRHSVIFHDSLQLPLTELFVPGQCTILQLNEIREREQQVIVATLLRRLYQARVDAVKGTCNAKSPDFLPYPTFTLIEEAHHFAPANADAVTSSTLKQILAEGRKFGVAIGLISQRPGKLDSDVLSQCMTQCIMRIVNPLDQDKVAQSIESVGRDLLSELPSLSKGQVIVAGSAVNTPILCRVRRRLTAHGAESIDAPAEWSRYGSRQESERRQLDIALPAEWSDRPSLEDLLRTDESEG